MASVSYCNVHMAVSLIHYLLCVEVDPRYESFDTYMRQVALSYVLTLAHYTCTRSSIVWYINLRLLSIGLYIPPCMVAACMHAYSSLDI